MANPAMAHRGRIGPPLDPPLQTVAFISTYTYVRVTNNKWRYLLSVSISDILVCVYGVVDGNLFLIGDSKISPKNNFWTYT